MNTMGEKQTQISNPPRISQSSFSSSTLIYCFICFGCGVAVAVVSFGLMFSIFKDPTRELIGSWQSINLGMSKSEVTKSLGQPTVDMPVGSGIPSWAIEFVPKGYEVDHGHLIYIYPGAPYCVLIIFLDEANRVTWVASYYS